MRKHLVYILVLVISVAMCTASVSAANNQNLYWAIGENQRFDYDSHSARCFNEANDYSRDIRVYNIVTTLPTIPENVDNIGDYRTSLNWTTYYENGTTPNFNYIWDAIPVGNWTLIIDLWVNQMGVNEGDIIDTPELIGYNSTGTSGDYTHIYANIYSKSTGALYTYQSTTYYDLELSTYWTTEIVLITDVMPIIYLGVIGGAIVIALIIIIMKRK